MIDGFINTGVTVHCLLRRRHRHRACPRRFGFGFVLFCLLERRENFDRQRVNVERFQFCKRSRHVQQTEHDACADANLKRAFARFVGIDGHLDTRLRPGEKLRQLLRARLECASRFTRLDDNDAGGSDGGIGCGGGYGGYGRRFRFLRGGLALGFRLAFGCHDTTVGDGGNRRAHAKWRSAERVTSTIIGDNRTNKNNKLFISVRECEDWLLKK